MQLGGRSCDRVVATLLMVIVVMIVTNRNDSYAMSRADDEIKWLPGQPGPVAFKQYSGYITVNSTAGRAFFYYFVEALNATPSTPLTLWLNGGPGCSSLGYGAFSELGPFFPTKEGNLITNDNAWNKYSNLLFVESPAGVGFSFSNTASDYSHKFANDNNTAKDNLKFLLNWLDNFPEYNGRTLYIIGESYAGHYVPQLAKEVLKYMETNGQSILNLKAIAIGNPALDDTEDFKSNIMFLWTHGLNSYQTAATINKYCNWTANSYSRACGDALDQSEEEAGDNFDKYDVILDVCLEEPIKKRVYRRLRKQKDVGEHTHELDVCVENEVTTYFNRHDVQVAMHANTSLPYPWSLCTSVTDYDLFNSPSTMIPTIKSILDYGIRILIYSGDQDSVVPLIGTGIIVKRLAKLMSFYPNSSYRNWFQGPQVGGWTIAYGNGTLTFATVRGAAHFVPRSQGARALTLFQYFVSGVPLPNSPQASS